MPIPESRLYKRGTSTRTTIVNTKFVLIILQAVCLTMMINRKDMHFFFPDMDFRVKSTDQSFIDAKEAAEGTFLSAIYCWFAFLAVETLALIVGWSLTVDSLNFLQIIIHFLGTLFSIWFLTDTWNYKTIWVIWTFFGLIPMILEFTIFIACVKTSGDLMKNSNLITRFNIMEE